MTVKFAMEGAVAVATFSAPPMNLFTLAALEGFEAAMNAALAEKARAFLTLAEGDHFCAGADVVGNFLGVDSNGGRRSISRGLAVLQRFEQMPIPTVIAARGLCLGAGCEILQIHDIVFAGEGALIGQVEAQIGTTTLLGGASRLVPRIGAARAKEFVFSAQPLDARTLQGWGLVNQIAPDAKVEDAARAYARKLAAGPTIAYRWSKALINTAASNGIAAADALVLEGGPATFDSKDMRNAVKRFAEKGARAYRDGLEFLGE